MPRWAWRPDSSSIAWRRRRGNWNTTPITRSSLRALADLPPRDAAVLHAAGREPLADRLCADRATGLAPDADNGRARADRGCAHADAMKTATAPYLVQQNQLQTQPRLFVRFYAIPSFASAVDYAFSRDFSTGEILQPTTEKLTMLMKVAGVAQSISPELGQSTIGQVPLTFQDRAGEILRHMGQRVLRLNATMTATDPPSGGALMVIEDPSGFPTTGTLDVFTGGVA